MAEYVRIQAKGQVTIPTRIRRKLNLHQGDLVSFVETENGILIKPAEVVFTEALEELSEALQASGISLEELIERGHQIREEIAKEKYGLKKS